MRAIHFSWRLIVDRLDVMIPSDQHDQVSSNEVKYILDYYYITNIHLVFISLGIYYNISVVHTTEIIYLFSSLLPSCIQQGLGYDGVTGCDLLVNDTNLLLNYLKYYPSLQY